MTWNFRVLDHGTHFALHEVHYDEQGTATSWTADPVTFTGDTLDDVITDLERALHDARNRPILRIP